MRARWFDFGLVLLVVILEFKGYFPRSPKAILNVFNDLFGGSANWAVGDVAPSEVLTQAQSKKEGAGPTEKRKKETMSNPIKQLIQAHITGNKVAVLVNGSN